MNVKNSVIELIGGTPLVRAERIEKKLGLHAELYLKLESANPASSAKDRIAAEMLDDAEKRGLISDGATIIEPTSGNTGIGLAMVAAAKGYKAVIVMPDTMSLERRRLMTAFGAELVLTDGAKGMAGCVEKARELQESIKNSYIPDQFSNPANAAAHYKTTGPELWNDMDGKVDIFVATIGTGGTITGVGRYLKEKDPSVRVIGVEPEASPLITKGTAGAHKIQGIGANFVPDVLDMSVVDEVLTVSDEDAYRFSRLSALCEGLLVGISSGAALRAAVEAARRPESRGKNIVVFMTDSGERYLSTEGFID